MIENRLSRAKMSLDGLSCADALGEFFFASELRKYPIVRTLPLPTWKYTDDSEMALGIYETLEYNVKIDQDYLAARLAKRYSLNPSRGYGPKAHEILAKISSGSNWREVSNRVFEGQGSCGNGSAMRVAPLGAFFADDLEQLVDNARASAVVTHTHPEGIAGAIAIAAAAAFACNKTHDNIFDCVIDLTPNSQVAEGVLRAKELPPSAAIIDAVRILGNGGKVTCQDTVPFAIWCINRNLYDYESGVWDAISSLGDIDTMAAIVGGVVILSSKTSIPAKWIESREPLDIK